MWAMSEKRGFEFLEHTADAYVAAYGKNMSKAFENAALAMFQVMTRIDRIAQTVEDAVEVEAVDEQALLYSWLEALLVKFEVQGMLHSKFKILNLGKTPTGFKLEARIWGEKFNQKHPP